MVVLVLLACVITGGVLFVWGQMNPTLEFVPAVSQMPAATVAPSGISEPVSLPAPIPTQKAPALNDKPVSIGLSTEALLHQVDVPARDRLDLALRLGLSAQPVPPVVRENPVSYQLGDQQTFWVSESDPLLHFEETAVLRYVGEHSYWWVQDGYGVPDAAIVSSAQAFEDKIYPTNRAFFGSEWSPGVDGDPRIHVFIGNVPGVGGYFYSVNEYSKQINPYSNEKEMFYININAAQPGTDYLDSILAHEFQHMIHWHNDANEDTWINEGLSELAMALNGYDTGGVAYSFTQNPDTQLNAWGNTPNASITHYGGSYLFMSYFLERFGEDLMRQVVALPDNGTTGFDIALSQAGRSEKFDDVFADWLVANYLDSSAPTGEASTWSYAGQSVGPVALAADHGDYPVTQGTTVSQYGADYISFRGNGDLTLSFTGTTKVKIAPNDAHSGLYQWWSNRGDDSDMTLTRTFDLSAVETASLQFWLWYDIERDWDFAFFEASTDGGETWQILPGRFTTTDNKSGNSFGHAWTGISGDGDKPQWVQEEIDLSAYAGQVINVRFEYITDDAVNQVGLLLDDISLPEIGYFDDLEAGDGGWQGSGFVRIDNILPQRYLVQLIEQGDTAQVRRLELDANNIGQVTVPGLGVDVDRVVLVVSGRTPFTTEPATYSYSAQITP